MESTQSEQPSLQTDSAIINFFKNNKVVISLVFYIIIAITFIVLFSLMFNTTKSINTTPLSIDDKKLYDRFTTLRMIALVITSICLSGFALMIYNYFNNGSIYVYGLIMFIIFILAILIFAIAARNTLSKINSSSLPVSDQDKLSRVLYLSNVSIIISATVTGLLLAYYIYLNYMFYKEFNEALKSLPNRR